MRPARSPRYAAGQDVPATRARLLAEHHILTTACVPERAARRITLALLRVSPTSNARPAICPSSSRHWTAMSCAHSQREPRRTPPRQKNRSIVALGA